MILNPAHLRIAINFFAENPEVFIYIKPNRIRVDPPGNKPVDTIERAATNEKNIAGI